MGSSIIFLYHSLSSIVSQGRHYRARNNTHVATYLFPRSIAHLRIAIDHRSKGPCAERKAQHCVTSKKMQGNVGNRGKRQAECVKE